MLPMAFFLGGGGYQIRKGVVASAATPSQISQTLAAGDTKKFTLDFWVKPNPGVAGYVYGYDRVGSNDHGVYCGDGGGGLFAFRFFDRQSMSFNMELQTAGIAPNSKGWFHIHAECDTAQEEASDRARLWINGVVPSFTTATYPALNYTTLFADGGEHRWFGSAGKYFDGILAEAHYCDGLIVPLAGFYAGGEPLRYAGSHGPRGSFLEFLNSGSLGADTSGNGNSWTASACTQTATTPTS